MARNYVHSVNVAEIALENILLHMEGRTFSKDDACAIIGSKEKLLQLIATGEVRAEKRCLSQNGKWYCNAADVLRHSRNLRR